MDFIEDGINAHQTINNDLPSVQIIIYFDYMNDSINELSDNSETADKIHCNLFISKSTNSFSVSIESHNIVKGAEE